MKGSESDQALNRQMSEKIKRENFEYGCKEFTPLNRHTSVTKLNHNNKGNPLEIRTQLDVNQKNDLRSNHFEIGGTSAKITQSTNAMKLRPTSLGSLKESKQQLD